MTMALTCEYKGNNHTQRRRNSRGRIQKLQPEQLLQN